VGGSHSEEGCKAYGKFFAQRLLVSLSMGCEL